MSRDGGEGDGGHMAATTYLDEEIFSGGFNYGWWLYL